MTRTLTTLAPLLAAFAPLSAATPTAAQEPSPLALDAEFAQTWAWRPIGPAGMGGRVVAIAHAEDDPFEYWVATASGGLLHTKSGGITYEHQFDHETTVSLGHVAVAPSNSDIVWVGTGEANPRNSVSYGDGVYRSTDGGATWKRMGLEESFQIGRIAIHPEDPDIVYVGALGRLYGPNEERGLYKTTDGGKHWKKVLWVDEDTGVVDVDLSPADPDVILAATYQRRRDGFDTNDPAVKWGPGGGLWRSTDGGESWTRLGEGLPTCQLGRIGVDFCRSAPQVVYAIIETERIAKLAAEVGYLGVEGEDAEVGARLTRVVEGGPAESAGLAKGDLVVALDGEVVVSWEALLRELRTRKSGERVSVQYVREGRVFVAEVELGPLPEESRERETFGSGLGGQRANVQEEQGLGAEETGGVYRSDDGGVTWRRVNSVNPRPMYYSQIRVDPSDPERVYVLGTQLYRSEDGGKTFTPDGARGDVHVDHHALWIDPADGRHMLLGNDGGIYETRDRMQTWDHHDHVAIGQFYHVAIDDRPLPRVYGGLQDNGTWGGPLRTRRRRGPANADWIRIGGGDGFVCRVDPDDPDRVYYESQNGGMGRWHATRDERGFMRPRGGRGERVRFNWETPFLLSHHNSRIFYAAGNRVFRSLDRGDRMRPISPDLARTERGSGTALAESWFDPDVLWVGTDDGALWTTRDGGRTWIDLWEGPESRRVVATDTGEDLRASVVAELCAAADLDGDGALTEDEIPAELASIVARADADEDGTLDPEELATLAGRPLPGGAAPPADPLGGRWRGRLESEAGEGARVTLDLALGEGGAVSGTLRAEPGGASEVRGTFSPASGRLELTSTGEAPVDRLEGTVRGERLEAQVSLAGGLAAVRLVAERKEPVSADDPLVGTWRARARGDDVPAGARTFELRLVRREGGALGGLVRSDLGSGEIREGRFDPETGRLSLVVATDEGRIALEATLSEGRLEGTLSAAAGLVSVGFEAKRREPRRRAWAKGAEGLPLGALAPEPMWVTCLEPSRHEEGRVYLALDGHRSDRDEPFVYVSEDGGDTWRSLADGLPRGSARVIREDRVNPDLLYLGTEFALWVSIDRGLSWRRITALPTVAIHEVAQHETTGDLVVATHGRSLWAADASALRQMTGEALAAEAWLFRPAPVVRWRREPSRSLGGPRTFFGETPPDGAELVYRLGSLARSVELRVRDADGTLVHVVEEPSRKSGLHAVRWNLLLDAPRERAGEEGRRRRRRRGFAPPGSYHVELVVDGRTFVQPLEVRADPEFPDAPRAAQEAGEADGALR